MLQGMEGLAQLEQDWRAITDSCPNVPFYQRYEWYHAYLGCLEPQPDEVYFYLVKKDHDPVSIFPLKKQYFDWYGFRLRGWVTPRTDEIPLSDFIGRDSGSITAEFKYVVEKLNSTKNLNFDGIFLRRVMEGGNAWTLINDDSLVRKITTHHSYSKYLECSSTVNNNKPGGSTKFKRNLRRLEKRLNTRGKVSWELDVSQELCIEALSLFMEVEASGWKGKQGTKTAIKYNSRAKEFYIELLKSFGALGRFRINLLKLDGHVIAGQYCLMDDDEINLLKIGYDQGYSDCSPGYLLIRSLFENGCESGEFEKLSFVTGADWNDVFQPLHKNVFIVTIMNNTIKGWVYYGYAKLKYFLKYKVLQHG